MSSRIKLWSMTLIAGLGIACGEPEPPQLGEAFVAMHREHARDVDERDLKRRIISTLFADDPIINGSSPADLRTAIIEELNIGFLIDQLDDGYLARTAMTFDDGPVIDGVSAYSLTVNDPLLPLPVEALVLAGPGRRVQLDPARGLQLEGGAVGRPAIVALHGHGQAPASFQRVGYGQELAAQGHIVVIPKFWYMDCDVQEASLSELLLQRGFSLMGLRVYKALLLLRVLASSEAIDPARLGLLGHSGGSSVSWLVVRLTDQVRARVWDYEQFFNDLCSGRIHCETHPGLFAIAGDIFRRASLLQPTLEVPYAYLAPDVRDDIRAFFAEELQP